MRSVLSALCVCLGIVLQLNGAEGGINPDLKCVSYTVGYDWVSERMGERHYVTDAAKLGLKDAASQSVDAAIKYTRAEARSIMKNWKIAQQSLLQSKLEIEAADSLSENQDAWSVRQQASYCFGAFPLAERVAIDRLDSASLWLGVSDRAANRERAYTEVMYRASLTQWRKDLADIRAAEKVIELKDNAQESKAYFIKLLKGDHVMLDKSGIYITGVDQADRSEQQYDSAIPLKLYCTIKSIRGNVFFTTDESIEPWVVALKRLPDFIKPALPFIGSGKTVTLHVPSQQAYGRAGVKNVPGNMALIVTVRKAD